MKKIFQFLALTVVVLIVSGLTNNAIGLLTLLVGIGVILFVGKKATNTTTQTTTTNTTARTIPPKTINNSWWYNFKLKIVEMLTALIVLIIMVALVSIAGIYSCEAVRQSLTNVTNNIQQEIESNPNLGHRKVVTPLPIGHEAQQHKKK